MEFPSRSPRSPSRFDGREPGLFDQIVVGKHRPRGGERRALGNGDDGAARVGMRTQSYPARSALRHASNSASSAIACAGRAKHAAN
ncbi:MAG: hypothetical protein DI640_15585, partial [Sphingomonas taxi]